MRNSREKSASRFGWLSNLKPKMPISNKAKLIGAAGLTAAIGGGAVVTNNLY
jgi:hypothetical protein